ncbi:hypothetical protein M8C21_013252, partial [Ambrosia artemisiifolia]
SSGSTNPNNNNNNNNNKPWPPPPSNQTKPLNPRRHIPTRLFLRFNRTLQPMTPTMPPKNPSGINPLTHPFLTPLPLLIGTENISANSPRKQTNANNKRSMKRGGGGGSFNKNVAVTGPDLENATGKEGELMKGGVGVQSNNGNERQNQRHAYRRSNSGPHSRGDGSYHHGYGGKRDQDREWNQHSRSFNGRDAHTQRGYPRGGYVRPAVHAPPPTFIPPQMPMLRPFGNNMMYPGEFEFEFEFRLRNVYAEMPSPMFYYQGPPPPPAESLRGMAPVVGPPIPPPMYFVSDPMLYARIVAQIDYYFSNDNLVKDTYLRKNMDEQGWVPVSLIAGFKKNYRFSGLNVLRVCRVFEILEDRSMILVRRGGSAKENTSGVKRRTLCSDNVQCKLQPGIHIAFIPIYPLILDAMRASTIVEVQPPAQAGENQDVLASQLQGVSLDDATSTVQDSVH